MMEPEDMIVLVVVDDDESGKSLEKDNLVTNSCMEVENIIETAQKHGQFIDVKTEPEDYEEYDYLDSEFKPEVFSYPINKNIVFYSVAKVKYS